MTFNLENLTISRNGRNIYVINTEIDNAIAEYADQLPMSDIKRSWQMRENNEMFRKVGEIFTQSEVGKGQLEFEPNDTETLWIGYELLTQNSRYVEVIKV